MTGTRIEQWPWAGGPEVDWLRGSGVCGADPIGVVTAGGRDLVVLGPLDDWRSSDGNLGCGGVLLGGEGPILVVWDKSGVRVLPSGCPALPWLVVEPEGELAEILAALICAVPSQWCQESSENLPETQGSVTLPEDPEWAGAHLPIPVPQGAPAEYLLVVGRRGGSVVMRECAGICDDWWQDPADLEAVDCVPEGIGLPEGWNGVTLGRTHVGHPTLVTEDVAGAKILCGEVAGDPVAEIVNGQLRRLRAPALPTCALLTVRSTAEGRAQLDPGATLIVTDAEILAGWGSTARPHRSLHHLSAEGDHLVIIDHGPLLPAHRPADRVQEYHSATVVRRERGDAPITTTLWWAPGDDTPRQVGNDCLAGHVIEGWYHPFVGTPVDPLLLGLWRELVG
ncbi:hypothetical protein JMX53_01535 [Cutibacterium avidum]|uniref:hypothetical protein n=1 Tax=Cutibacterium avidum TaxID=33010 RepID=UPI00192BC350|nr:hypothetical protein [Cutibacterium avidum]QQY15315.1 hypothetical protein JMX53_01535 [Cutibacterium avidum]